MLGSILLVVEQLTWLKILSMFHKGMQPNNVLVFPNKYSSYRLSFSIKVQRIGEKCPKCLELQKLGLNHCKTSLWSGLFFCFYQKTTLHSAFKRLKISLESRKHNGNFLGGFASLPVCHHMVSVQFLSPKESFLLAYYGDLNNLER